MKRYWLIGLPGVIVGLVGYAHFSTPNYGRDHCFAGCPVATATSLTELDKTYFSIGYDEQRRNPAWVCYRLGPILPDYEPQTRPGKFATDYDTAARVTHESYTNSGYDRGHLAPLFGIASRFGPKAGRATFVMSNVAPQLHGFNAGMWRQLESLIAGSADRRIVGSASGGFREGWADRYERVWVVVGPILTNHKHSRGRAGQETEGAVWDGWRGTVPAAYFCIVIDEESAIGGPRVLAFVLPHLEHDDNGLRDYLVSVDMVELATGLDFFTRLPDDIEERLERGIASDLWPLAGREPG